MRLYLFFYVYVIGLQVVALCISVFFIVNSRSTQGWNYTEESVNSEAKNEVNEYSKRVAVSLMACSRPRALNLSLYSIHQAQSRRRETVSVFVTMDCGKSEAMREVVEWWSKTLRGLNYEWYVEAGEERNDEFKDERVARHWYWSVQRLFQMGFEYVVHLEDDHVVAGTFFVDLMRLLDWANTAQCYNMGCGGDCWGSASGEAGHVTWMEAGNMGVVYSRKFWDVMGSDKVKRRFCGMRGNWDINVHVLQSEGLLSVPCATYARSRVGHMVGVSARSSVWDMQEGMPRFDGKFKEDAAVELVDVGGASYQLENHESDNALPQKVKDKCMEVVGIESARDWALSRLKQTKHVEGRDCMEGFMDLSPGENVFRNWKKRDKARKIVVMSPYDCELEMLIFKLEEMGPYIDYFIIVESSVSNSNKERAMCFNASLVGMSEHSAKIIYRQSHQSVANFNYWEQEVYVKNQMGLPLKELGLADDDLVVMMDMDEVVSGRHMYYLRNYEHLSGSTAFKIGLRWSYYGFEWVNPELTIVNAMVSWLQFRSVCGMKANAVRYNLCGLDGADILSVVGWHCSWCFAETKQFISKIERSSKLEDNKEKFKNIEFLQDQRGKGLWFVDGTPNGCYAVVDMPR